MAGVSTLTRLVTPFIVAVAEAVGGTGVFVTEAVAVDVTVRVAVAGSGVGVDVLVLVPVAVPVLVAVAVASSVGQTSLGLPPTSSEWQAGVGVPSAETGDTRTAATKRAAKTTNQYFTFFPLLVG